MSTNVFALHTARATIRPWRMDEAALLLDIRRREEVARWLASPVPWADVATARGHIGRWAEDATEVVPGTCAIVPDASGVPVGAVSLNPLPDDTEVEIGWYLHPDAHGRGWATEAATALLAHGLAGGVPRVWACMWPDNEPSAAVCQRLGMDDLGVGVDPWYGTDEFPDSRMFCSLAPGVCEDVAAVLAQRLETA